MALKEAELQQEVNDELARLARIKFHIRQIDMEANMSQLDIRIKKLEPVRGLTYRYHCQHSGTMISASATIFVRQFRNTASKPLPNPIQIYPGQ